MTGLIRRAASGADQRLVLLAPQRSPVPRAFGNVPTDALLSRNLLHEVQRLRGRVYLDDGAILPSELTADGRHETPEDHRAWHLLTLHRDRVTACVWFLEHDHGRSFEDLRVRNCPLAEDEAWCSVLRRAVESELRRAHRLGLRYAELGGWAVDHDHRHTGEGLLLALTTYSLGRAFGGALGLTTATVRHASSTILRRLGGASLEAGGRVLPAYYDGRYQCEMELLRFDSRHPNPKYDAVIDVQKTQLLAAIPVIASTEDAEPADSVSPAVRWRAVAGGAVA